MEEIGKALKTIFDKLSDFFDIFDLSFFVSGFATTISILFWLYQRHLFSTSYLKFDGVVVVAILICYLNGLISFAAGRWIRMGAGNWLKSRFGKKLNQYQYFDQSINAIIKAHGLSENILCKEYLTRNQDRGTWRLYVRFWAVIRENSKYAQSLSLLKRYWVMAATYDGLSISVVIMFLLFMDLCFGITGHSIAINTLPAIFFSILLIFFFFACVREAGRYVTYQVEEVVATIAAGQ